MFWDYGGPKAGKAGSAGAAGKANGTAQKPNGVQADGAFGTTMSPDFKVRSVALHHMAVHTQAGSCVHACKPCDPQMHIPAPFLLPLDALACPDTKQ